MVVIQYNIWVFPHSIIFIYSQCHKTARSAVLQTQSLKPIYFFTAGAGQSISLPDHYILWDLIISSSSFQWAIRHHGESRWYHALHSTSLKANVSWSQSFYSGGRQGALRGNRTWWHKCRKSKQWGEEDISGFNSPVRLKRCECVFVCMAVSPSAELICACVHDEVCIPDDWGEQHSKASWCRMTEMERVRVMHC